MTNDELVMLVVFALPYPDQIKDLDTTKLNAIYFSWRGDRFRVTADLHADTVEGSLLVGNSISIVLRALLHMAKAVRS